MSAKDWLALWTTSLYQFVHVCSKGWVGGLTRHAWQCDSKNEYKRKCATLVSHCSCRWSCKHTALTFFLYTYPRVSMYVCVFIYFYCYTLIEIGFLELTNHFNCGALGAWCIAEWWVTLSVLRPVPLTFHYGGYACKLYTVECAL